MGDGRTRWLLVGLAALLPTVVSVVVNLATNVPLPEFTKNPWVIWPALVALTILSVVVAVRLTAPADASAPSQNNSPVSQVVGGRDIKQQGGLHASGLTAIGSTITMVGGNVTNRDPSVGAVSSTSAGQEIQPTPVLRWITIDGTYEVFSERLAWQLVEMRRREQKLPGAEDG